MSQGIATPLVFQWDSSIDHCVGYVISQSFDPRDSAVYHVNKRNVDLFEIQHSHYYPPPQGTLTLVLLPEKIKYKINNYIQYIK